jgi:hypothetical protein
MRAGHPSSPIRSSAPVAFRCQKHSRAASAAPACFRLEEQCHCGERDDCFVRDGPVVDVGGALLRFVRAESHATRRRVPARPREQPALRACSPTGWRRALHGRWLRRVRENLATLDPSDMFADGPALRPPRRRRGKTRCEEQAGWWPVSGRVECEEQFHRWVSRSRILPVASLPCGATRSAELCRSRFKNQARDGRQRRGPSTNFVRRSRNATNRPTRRLASFGPSASGSRSSRVVSGTSENRRRWAIVTCCHNGADWTTDATGCAGPAWAEGAAVRELGKPKRPRRLTPTPRRRSRLHARFRSSTRALLPRLNSAPAISPLSHISVDSRAATRYLVWPRPANVSAHSGRPHAADSR